MKPLLIVLTLSISLHVTSQEFNDAYLKSLPPSVQQDVQKKIETKDQSTEPVYRSPSTFVDKNELDKSNTVTIFGSEFFDVMQTTFMPTNEPNLDPSYILDFGDVIKIQLIGQKNEIKDYVIEKDGSINLDNIGKIFLSGLSLNSASELIKAKVSSSYIGTESYITLTSIRDINILVVGNAFNPGIYTLNGNSNVLHALSMAGGISDIGSYRNISLIRNGKTIDTFDLYQVFITGQYKFLSGLRSGDSIVVNPQGNLVAIESGVVRPAIYELKEDEYFDDILRYANGYSNNKDLSNIVIKRISGGSSQTIKLTADELQVFKFINNDSIFIREFKIDTVVLEGAVVNPGTYKINRGTTLSDLIEIAGGYEESAYPFGGYLENKKAYEINSISKDKLYDKFLSNLLTQKGPSSSSLDNSSIQDLAIQLKEAQVTGRIIAEFDLSIIKNNPSLDTKLEDGDRIFIPQTTQQVYIQGQVNNAGAIRYSPGKDLNYYINKSGGFLRNADEKNIFIVHPNGETENLANLSKISRLSFLIEDDEKQLIYPGSIIYVPQNTNLKSSIEVAAIWAPIISSLALSLTSLSVLNNNN